VRCVDAMVAERLDDPSSTQADVREGGRWTPLQRVKNHALYVIAIAALGATRWLPSGVLRSLGRAAGIAAHALAGAARRTALANVGRVFPELDAARRRVFVRRCFITLGGLLGETVALLRAPCPAPLAITPEARAVIDQALREGRGVVFASAHLGPWEQVAASLVTAGVPLVTLARESYDPRFSRLYERLRGVNGVRVVWRGSAGAATRIVRTLRRGGVLGVPLDLRSRVRSCEVPFLGHDAPTALGPARIALRTRAAVIVGTAAPGKSGAIVITATRLPAEGQGDAAARALTARINAEISRRILALPHAWVWMHERWRSKATGESAL
jgi:KDO2-lipid IV(A) lauroyltransferase